MDASKWAEQQGERLRGILDASFDLAVAIAGQRFPVLHGREPDGAESKAAVEAIWATFSTSVRDNRDEIVSAFAAGDGERLYRMLISFAAEAARAADPPN